MPATYEQIKGAEAARRRAISRDGRDIGKLPPVRKPRRKRRAAKDFRYHLESYHPQTFYLPWSRDHLSVIKSIETAVLHGGLFAMAMPRGSGKTSLAEVAAEWAVLHGHAMFPAVIGATEAHATEILDSIKAELESNDLLLEDFPEVVYPIHCLEGIHNRAPGQLFAGKRTQITWTTNEIVLPTMPKSKASGAILKVAGITGRVRGMKFKRQDGSSPRPDLVIVDDPQTDESARSTTQCQSRESVLAGAVLGLAGPGKKISGVMPCTVIRPGDVADRILDRDKNPDWNGTRTRLVYSFPTNEKLWDQYQELRNNGLREGDGGAAATEFYSENRSAMDAGADVAWPERFKPDELSAVQNAMNLMFRDKGAFFAEYQNDPLPDRPQQSHDLTADIVAKKVGGFERDKAPPGVQHVTAFIDVQQDVLFYLVAGWEKDFTGYVLDYGAFPDQQRRYWTLGDARRTLSAAYPGKQLQGWLYAGFEDLCAMLLTKEYGPGLKITRLLIDANWGNSTKVVKKFSFQTVHHSVVMPSHGVYVGAASLRFGSTKPAPGDSDGLNWRVKKPIKSGDVRHVFWDTNWWKSFVARAFHTAQGDRGCLSLFGNESDAHQLFAEHCTAEYCVRTTGRGRDVDEWKDHQGRDNHWWDCMVGAAVAASMLGCEPPGTGVPRAIKRKRRGGVYPMIGV
jgi:hypothetical protein